VDVAGCVGCRGCRWLPPICDTGRGDLKTSQLNCYCSTFHQSLAHASALEQTAFVVFCEHSRHF